MPRSSFLSKNYMNRIILLVFAEAIIMLVGGILLLLPGGKFQFLPFS